MQKVLLGVPTLVCVTKNKNDFLSNFTCITLEQGLFSPKGELAVVQSWPLTSVKCRGYLWIYTATPLYTIMACAGVTLLLR